MHEYNFLIPEKRDSTRELHSAEMWDWFHNKLIECSNGYTRDDNTCVGYWRNEKQELIEDASYRFSISIEEAKRTGLMRVISEACKQFDQEVIYFAGGPQNEVLYIDENHSEPVSTLLDWVMGQLAVVEDKRFDRPASEREAGIVIELKNRCTDAGLLDFALGLPELPKKTPRDCRIQLLRCLKVLGA